MTQRITLAQTQLQMAQAAPDIHNLKEAYRKMYIALNVKDIDAILPPDEEIPPRDPISEQQSAMKSEPIKAYDFQNQEAYIAAHSAFLQNPMIQQNPVATQTIGANIQERQAILYKQQIEQAMGQPLPSMDGPMPPELMNEIAMAAATATQNPQMEMFQQQLQLEKEQLAQKEQEDLRDKDIDVQRINAQREATQIKAAIDLQELEAKTQSDADKNFTELVKTVQESNNNLNGE